MARLQILELPTVERPDGTEETPFILVIDGWDILSFDENTMLNDYWDAFAQKIGARGVLFTDRTIDIPANEVPVDPDGYPLKIRVEGDFETFHEQVQDEIRRAQAELTQAMRAAKTLPDSMESTGRPTHPDGTPYNYNEIVAGGWSHCDGCRTWGQWTSENPHDCPNTHVHGPENPTA